MASSFFGDIAQIIIDLAFSVDSIITAVGIVSQVGVMMLFAHSICESVSDQPTIKILALSFQVVVGAVLIADRFGHYVPNG